VSSLSRLPDGGNRADLCQALGLANASVLAPSIGVGHETGVERTPAEPGHLEEREDRLDRHLRGDLPADDHAARGVDEHRRRPSLRSCGRRSGPRLCGRSDVPTERPGERGRGRRRHHGVSLVVTPRRCSSPPNPGYRHEPGHLVPPDVVAARVAATT